MHKHWQLLYKILIACTVIIIINFAKNSFKVGSCSDPMILIEQSSCVG